MKGTVPAKGDPHAPPAGNRLNGQPMRDFQATTPASQSGLASVLAELTRLLNDHERQLDKTLDGILALGCRRLALDLGVIARVRGTAYDVRSLSAMFSRQPSEITSGVGALTRSLPTRTRRESSRSPGRSCE